MTWYFSMGNEPSFQGPTVKDWLLNTSLYCIKGNKKFEPSTTVRIYIEQEKDKIAKLTDVLSPRADQ